MIIRPIKIAIKDFSISHENYPENLHHLIMLRF